MRFLIDFQISYKRESQSLCLDNASFIRSALKHPQLWTCPSFNNFPQTTVSWPQSQMQCQYVLWFLMYANLVTNRRENFCPVKSNRLVIKPPIKIARIAVEDTMRAILFGNNPEFELYSALPQARNNYTNIWIEILCKRLIPFKKKFFRYRSQ